jgi:hypothetical protein
VHAVLGVKVAGSGRPWPDADGDPPVSYVTSEDAAFVAALVDHSLEQTGEGGLQCGCEVASAGR